jgi:hypothetical protein
MVAHAKTAASFLYLISKFPLVNLRREDRAE